jgi:uncharacterized protein HemX
MGVGALAVASFIGAGAAVAGTVQARKQAKIAKQAQSDQQKQIAKQEGIQAKADKRVAEQTALEQTKLTERRARTSQGRKGLLFEGKETGVTNKTDTLGG